MSLNSNKKIMHGCASSVEVYRRSLVMSVDQELPSSSQSCCGKDVSFSIGLGLVWVRQAHVIMSKWLSPRASLKSFQQPHREKDSGGGGRGGKDGKNQRTIESVETCLQHRVGQMTKVEEGHLIGLMWHTVAMRNGKREKEEKSQWSHTPANTQLGVRDD